MSTDSRTPHGRRVRLELEQRHAQALHAALSEALNAELLAGDRRDAAREVLERLDGRVPGWLQSVAPGGEAGYLLAAEAVLRALVDAEDGEFARSSLSESELLGALGDAKPLGATATDVFERMRRERMIVRAEHHEQRWWSAAPAGRQFLHRDIGARHDAWAVRRPLELLDLVHADSRGSGVAFRPWVQAVGRLEQADLAPLAAALRSDELLQHDADEVGGRQWLSLTAKGSELARARWRESHPGQRFAFDRPSRPPLPYRRELPIRGLTFIDRSHPSEGLGCPPAAWLQRSSSTKLWATLRRDGVVEWSCRHCERAWLVYLQATTRDGQPAFGDPTTAACNQPEWRPDGYRWRR